MSQWDGQERRGSDCCNGEMQSRVRALEVYKETQAKDIDRLVKSHDMLTTELKETNNNLINITNKLTEVKTSQRHTHMLVGVIGSVFGSIIGFLTDYLGKLHSSN